MAQQLIDALKSAHALESKLVTMLEKQASATEDFPEIQAKIREHMEETRRHATLVEECLESLGDDKNTLQSGTSALMGNLEGMIAGATSNIVALSAANFGIENLEIATYNAIRVMAENSGQDRVTEVADEILSDEIEMADWLEENLEETVESYLSMEMAKTSTNTVL